MIYMHPKRFKEIKNKTIPNPLRPKFRNKSQSNIYFLSQRKVSGEKKILFIKRIKLAAFITSIIIGGYLLTT